MEYPRRFALRRRVALLVALGLAQALRGITVASTAPTDPQVAAIRAVGERWRALYEAGRYAEIPELYTDDCLVMPRGHPAIVGREQMRHAVGGLAAGRKVDISIELREIVVRGDYAWSVAEFEVRYSPRDTASAPRTEHARSLVIYRRDADGTWRIHRDIDSPAPEPTGETPWAARSTLLDAGALGHLDRRRELAVPRMILQIRSAHAPGDFWDPANSALGREAG